MLWLVLLLALLAVVLGIYLASRGLHPRQLRRRRISHVSREFQPRVQCVITQFQRKLEPGSA